MHLQPHLMQFKVLARRYIQTNINFLLHIVQPQKEFKVSQNYWPGIFSSGWAHQSKKG